MCEISQASEYPIQLIILVKDFLTRCSGRVSVPCFTHYISISAMARDNIHKMPKYKLLALTDNLPGILYKNMDT